MDSKEVPECEWCGEKVFSPCNKDDSATCVLRSCINARNQHEPPRSYDDDLPKSHWGKALDKQVLEGAEPEKSDQEFKADGGKSNPALLEAGMPRALEVCNDTLDYGAIKYEAHSWRGVPNGIERYDSAARRHRRARDMGETHDIESHIMHLGHEIICNLFQLELMLMDNPALRQPFNRNPPQGHKS